MKGCCKIYHASNRSKKTVVENMKLVEEDIDSNSGFVGYENDEDE